MKKEAGGGGEGWRPSSPGTLVAHKSNSDPELDVAFIPQVLSQKGEDRIRIGFKEDYLREVDSKTKAMVVLESSPNYQ